MKKIALGFGILIASVYGLFAQVSVEVTLDQDQFLPGETMNAEVRITNRSGQTLHFGRDNAWLTFEIESKDGYVVVKMGEVPVQGEFSLDTSKRAIKHVDLAPYFRFPKEGRYMVTAVVTIKDWNQQITSPPKAFDIIRAAKLWEQQVGIPNPPGVTNRPPELRTYTLFQANYLRTHLMLYVQCSDSHGKIYRVFPIGPMLSFGQPEPQVDRFSNLHVLYQDGPRSFNHTIVDPDGTVLLRHEYDMAPRPKLTLDAHGDLQVVGGIRRFTSRDIPAPKTAENDVDAP
jgi:hypothetical protein